MPAGEYEVGVVLDLSPLFGKIEAMRTLAITPPPPDALDRRLADLADGDPAVRRRAVSELPFFTTDRATVAGALGRCLGDTDGVVRRMALGALQGYPEEAAARADTVLAILEDGAGRVQGERTNAALLASRTAPVSDRARAAFRKALAEATEREKPIFESALRFYLGRTAPAGSR